MKFNYQARNTTGQIQTGVVEATNKDIALDILKAHGLYVTALEEVVLPIYAKKVSFFEFTTKKDIVIFSRQLSIMLKSRIPLVEIFQTIAKQTSKAGFREKIMKIAEEVEGGSSLSKALSAFPKIFSSFYINMVKSGEATGKLTDVFTYLADYLERDYKFRSKIVAALIYPAFILVVFLIVGVIVVTFVIPQLTKALAESGQQLPYITRLIMGTSDFIRTKWWLVVSVIAILVIAFIRIIKTPKGKKTIDTFLLKVPLVGSFLKKFYMTRFALNLSTLVSGGLPIAQSLQIAGDVVGNTVYKQIIFRTRDEVRKGETISSVLQNYPKIISPLFFQMVVVGEKTGTLENSLKNVVDFYQSDTEKSLDELTRLIEPAMIVVLGVVVAVLMVGVILPIYSTIGNIQ